MPATMAPAERCRASIRLHISQHFARESTTPYKGNMPISEADALELATQKLSEILGEPHRQIECGSGEFRVRCRS